MPHFRVSAALTRQCWAATRDTDLKLAYGPVDVALAANVVQPDLLADPAALSITNLELTDGQYVKTAHAKGDHNLYRTSPFPITPNLANLARG